MKTVYVVFTYASPDDQQGDMVSLAFTDLDKAKAFVKERARGLINYFQSPDCLIEFEHSPQGEFVDHWDDVLDSTGKCRYHFTTSNHVPAGSKLVSEWQHVWGKMALYPLDVDDE